MPKTPAQYLADHNDDAQAALAAAAADVAQRESENATARSFRRIFEPLLRELDIPSTAEGAEQLMEALSQDDNSEEFAALVEVVESLTGVLEDLGIDFDVSEEELQAQLDALPEVFSSALETADEFEAYQAQAELQELASVGKASFDVLLDRLEATGLAAKIAGEAPKAGQQDTRTVRLYDEDGQDLGELREYASQNWESYLPSLFPPLSALSQGGKAVVAQAGAGAGAPSKEANPLTESISRRSAAAQGSEAAPVVDALSFK